MKLTDLINERTATAQVRSQERDEVIRELIDMLIADGVADASLRDELVELVLKREQMGSTGFGCGVAVPHVKHDGITRMAAAVGISHDGIDFNALDKQPVYAVFLLISPKSKPEEHLQAMEAIFNQLSNEAFRRTLRQSTDASEIVHVLKQADQHRITQ